MRKLILVLFIGVVLAAQGEVQAYRAIPDDNLAYPVFVQLNTGSMGSGFFINTPMKTYFVTAAHVLFNQEKGELMANQATLISYPRNQEETGKNIINLDLFALYMTGKIRKHKTQDIAVVEIGEATKTSTQLVHGVKKQRGAISGIIGVGINNVKHLKDVLIANQVYIFGYPTSLGFKELPQQLDPLRTLLRYGIVAGINHDLRTIIIDCPTYPGNSGGPVMEVEMVDPFNYKYSIIGVISQFVPYDEIWVNKRHYYENHIASNSGYSVVMPMDSVLELIDKRK